MSVSRDGIQMLDSYEIFQSSDKGKDELLRLEQAHLWRNVFLTSEMYRQIDSPDQFLIGSQMVQRAFKN